MAALLEVAGLAVRYGNVEAVCGLTFTVEEGGVVTLIGANGAGKSSTLLALSGLVRPWAGTVRFRGEDITRAPAERIVRAGLVQVAEGRAILGPLTVEENLEMGAWTRPEAVRSGLDRAYALFPRLEERRRQLAGSLSGGEQQMLAIARALMAKPRLLLLDEPSMGLAPLLVKTIFDTIQGIRAEGTTVLLVEQNARQALRIADRALVLSHGRIIREGPSRELLEDPVVTQAFLGKQE